jgi:hypothetical protein
VISTSSGGLYGCRGKRNGTCSNTRTIRRTRIEERVFAALAPALLSAEHEAAFAEAMALEMKRFKHKDYQSEIQELEKQLRRAEKVRRSILAAIEDGARYAAFKARFEEIEAAIADLEPKLATLMDDAEEDVLACMTFPAQHRTKLHGTNPIERLDGEIKRRTDVVGIFPNEAAIRRLVGAILMEQTEEWAVQRSRYIILETLAPVCDDPIVSLPAAQNGWPTRLA